MPVWRLEILLVGEFTNTETAGLRPDCVCTDKARAAEASLGMDSGRRGKQRHSAREHPSPQPTPGVGARYRPQRSAHVHRGQKAPEPYPQCFNFFY